MGTILSKKAIKWNEWRQRKLLAQMATLYIRHWPFPQPSIPPIPSSFINWFSLSLSPLLPPAIGLRPNARRSPFSVSATPPQNSPENQFSEAVLADDQAAENQILHPRTLHLHAPLLARPRYHRLIRLNPPSIVVFPLRARQINFLIRPRQPPIGIDLRFWTDWRNF